MKGVSFILAESSSLVSLTSMNWYSEACDFMTSAKTFGVILSGKRALPSTYDIHGYQIGSIKIIIEIPIVEEVVVVILVPTLMTWYPNSVLTKQTVPGALLKQASSNSGTCKRITIVQPIISELILTSTKGFQRNYLCSVPFTLQSILHDVARWKMLQMISSPKILPTISALPNHPKLPPWLFEGQSLTALARSSNFSPPFTRDNTLWASSSVFTYRISAKKKKKKSRFI